MKERTRCVDAVKGLACIAVILIHYNFPGDLGIAVKTMCRFAVPFFLCVSGYFFLDAKENISGRSVSLRKLKHTLRLLGFSALFYLVFDIVSHVLLDSSWNIVGYSASVVTLKKLVKLIITNDPLVYSHLWYLLGLVYCYAFTLLFKEGRYPGKWTLLCPIGLVFFLVYCPYKEVLGIKASWNIMIGTEVVTIYRFNLFLARALPFFLLGIILKKQQTFIRKIGIEKVLLKLVIFLGLTVSLFERALLIESQWYFGTILVVVGIFLWVIQYPEEGNETLVYIGKNLSLYVYVIHIAVGKTIGAVATKVGITGNNIYVYSKPFLIMAVSLGCAYVVCFVKKKMKPPL